MVNRIDDPELRLLRSASDIDARLQSGRLQHELQNAPLFTHASLSQLPRVFRQRGLLGSVIQQHGHDFPVTPEDKRLYVNTSAPCTAVVCGVQGSGKSHTVSCLLECSLIADDRIGNLPEPLAGIVFHFDEDNGDRPCEAAFLAIPRQEEDGHCCQVPEVTVLVSPSNLRTRRMVYAKLPNVTVQPLYLAEANLNASRMLSLMGCDDIESMPLYMLRALSILRQMGSDDFNYKTFKERLKESELTPLQREMFNMRTDLLDSYLSETARNITSWFGHGKLVIVDLSDPFLDGNNAAILFDIMLGIFVEWRSPSRHNKKIIVLDEAHKYLGTTIGSRFTKTIASLIRQQRHLGLRMVISTQEPTVIPATILDLSSYIICHRFSAPSWCTHLKRHVSLLDEREPQALPWMAEVMRLHTGEALVFSPNSVVVKADPSSDGRGVVARLGAGYLKVLTRPRITEDGGYSVMAVVQEASLSSPSSPQVVKSSLSSSTMPDVRKDVVCPTRGASPPCPTPPKTPDILGLDPCASNNDAGHSGQISSIKVTNPRVDPHFSNLVSILRKRKSAGHDTMRGCDLAAQVRKVWPRIYEETGFRRWKVYITQAEVLGIVRVEGGDFVRLTC